MGRRVLVVATWGLPAQWKEARYVARSEFLEALSKAMHSSLKSNGYVDHCTSLALLLDLLRGSGIEYRVAITVLDSLVDRYRGPSIDSLCYRCYDECFDGFENRVRRASSYGELLDVVKGMGRCMARCILGNYVDDDALDVIVAPAIGSPGGTWRFVGGARDFAAVLLSELSRIVEEFRPDALILDVTHGINYMPTQSMHVAKLVLGPLLVDRVRSGSSRGIDLLVINSDPYPPRVAKPELGMNLVYRERIRTLYRLDALPKCVAKPRRKIDLYEELRKVNDEYLRYVRAYAYLVRGPLPLALAYACSELGTDSDVVGRALDLWIETTTLSNNVVDHGIRLVPEAIYATIVATKLRRALNEIIEGIDGGVELEKLKTLARIYSLVDDAYEHLVLDEIGRIERSLETRGSTASSGWHRLCELYGECREVSEPERRTLIAHAGLQKEFVEIDPANKRVRYVKGFEMLNAVEKCMGITFEEPVC